MNRRVPELSHRTLCAVTRATAPFANVNSASQPNGYHFEYLNPAAGGGLRLQLNKKSGTNFCVDYGFSKGYSDLILSLGEAF